MGALETFEWSCTNCGEFHQYYGEHEQQPLEQDEPHQRQGSSGKKSIEEMLESFLVQQESINKRQEAIFNNNWAAIRNLETQIQKLSRQLTEEYQTSPISEVAISLERNEEELQIEENETCELIEESLTPQALEEDEEEEVPEEESPEEASEAVLALECEN